MNRAITNVNRSRFGLSVRLFGGRKTYLTLRDDRFEFLDGFFTWGSPLYRLCRSSDSR